MPKVNSLFLSSDFDTLKSDDLGTAIVTVPGSSGIASGATANYTATINVGESESLLLVRVGNNVDYADGSHLALSVSSRFDRVGGGATPYSIVVRYRHLTGDSVQLIASIFNNGASPLTTSATTDTFTFLVRSFKVPKFA